MTATDIATFTRQKTRTNSTTFTNEEIIVSLNVIKNTLALKALEIDEDIFLVPTYLSLVADQREYPFPTNILSRIKRVEAKLDGSNWLKLREFDLTQQQNPITTESNITTWYDNSEGNAAYDIMRKSLFIYSGTITDVTDGIRLWVNTFPADISDMTATDDLSVDPSSTTHGFPKELHGVLAKGIVIEWKGDQEKPLPLTQSEMRYEEDVKTALQALKRSDYDREILASTPLYSGEDY